MFEKINYDFFDLEFYNDHSGDFIPDEKTISKARGAKYLNHPIELAFIEDALRRIYNDKPRGPVDIFRDFFEEQKTELIRLNNLLFFQQQHFLEIIPFYPDNGKITFDPSRLEKFYGHFAICEDDFETEEEELELIESQLDRVIDIEEKKWVVYANLHQPGYVASAVLIYIEKLLIGISKKFSEYENKNDNFRQSKSSILDGRIKYLKEEFNLDLEIPPVLAEVLFKARIARNRFAHGNWEDLEQSFSGLTSKQLVECAYVFTNLLLLSIEKKMG